MRAKLTLALCVLLHAIVLINVWHAYKLTPRIIVVQSDAFCPRSHR